MSFFNNIEVSTTFTSQEDIKPIPDNTNAKAIIDDIAWAEWEGDQYINARWEIIDGEYKNRKIFQKIKVKDVDPKKREKAIKMLGAIDANCGGALMKANAEPDDFDLATNLVNKPMLIKIKTWEINGKSGNWVCAVAPAKQPVQQAESVSADIPF